MNRTIVIMLVVGCAVGVGIVFCADESAKTGKSTPAAVPAIDASKRPKDWGQNVKDAQKILDGMATDLIAIAKDEKRPADHRLAAIRLLGRIGNWRALQFLVSNVSVKIEPLAGGGYIGPWRPCRHRLVQLGLPGAQAIFKTLRRTKVSEEDMENLAIALRGIFDTGKAAQAVVYEKVRNVNPRAAKRLKQAIEKLEQKSK